MGTVAVAALGTAAVLDLVFEEFPRRIHPVALFGRLVGRFDRSWDHPETVGAVVALALPLGAAAVGGGFTMFAGSLHPLVGGLIAALALFATTSLRMLLSVAADVVGTIETDPEEARTAIRGLVGRDTTELSAGELRSAVVESIAENLADGLLAPLLAFALGVQLSLPVAVAAAIWVKAVNTLDSMLGYRSKPVGWASARLDDAVMWLPARLSAVLVALAGGSPTALARARRWQSEPSSPNSGWPMAAMAAVLDVELRKPGAYVLNPNAGLPTTVDARRAMRVIAVGGSLAVLLAGVAAWC
ncbi:adenosylcobinamide-phosphate synthase CbiB [Halococcus thailandensis]|uniref:Probable cobalamin biosynthesis protein CobD n=1 Tax=Halococcus thailandensis JCM 13552 TaxID=1227457 RepID=M0N244_9EURY|nr:adenosylcobinamide-phosphate synthase CbiB [Halococcus thailandensis]EMA51578.1 cobalamin biosynthesis protein CobD [Halococcus thailandensis JCM 13552]